MVGDCGSSDIGGLAIIKETLHCPQSISACANANGRKTHIVGDPGSCNVGGETEVTGTLRRRNAERKCSELPYRQGTQITPSTYHVVDTGGGNICQAGAVDITLKYRKQVMLSL